jgi:CBS domain-containing protein
MQVKDIMTKEVVAIKPNAKITEAANLLHERNLTGLPVIDKENKVIGIISEADFMTQNHHLHLPSYIQTLQVLKTWDRSDEKLKKEIKKLSRVKVSEIMNPEVITTSSETSLKDLAVLFAEKRVNPSPVTDRENHLLGIVSRSDIVRLFANIN